MPIYEGMKGFLIALMLCCTSLAQAQQQVTARVALNLHIPAFMQARETSTTEFTRAGKAMRRVTIEVEANQSWSLSVMRNCAEKCATVSVASGQRGTTAIVVEFETTADGGELRYALAAT